MIVSDAPNCGVTYHCHYNDRSSFIIQATVCAEMKRQNETQHNHIDHNNTQHIDIQHENTQHEDIQHNSK